MTDQLDAAVVGAGPFGLSIAAHLQKLSVRTFGREMSTWRERMPSGMLLRSAWDETSLSAPNQAGTIDAWLAATDEVRQEPIPLEMFLRYGAWFAERFVAERDQSEVTRIEVGGTGYRVTTEAGSEVDARRLVLAVGVMPFAYVPPELEEFLGDSISLATVRPDELERYAGRRVLVVGGGQAGLETAGLTAQAGATVELVTRSELRWFNDREPHYPRTPLRRRLYKLMYPAVGYGPPPLNRLVIHPDVFAALPESLRRNLTRRVLVAGGSPWLRTLIDKSVRISEHNTIANAEKTATGINIRLTDGSEREVDDVLIACGYRFNLDHLSFLAPDVRSRIVVRDGWPVIDRYFRSSDKNVIFVGYAAEHRFGPLSRFVLGADFAANRISKLF